MNLSKIEDWFEPDDQQIHIVGCGSVGSAVAEMLARSGVRKFTLWDFDTVCPHNVVNQMFTESQIGKLKTEALTDIILSINPDAEIKLKNAGWSNEKMSGYIFLCCDGIELRRSIVEAHKMNMGVKAMFDFRTELTGAQHYACEWGSRNNIENFLATMDFSHDEAQSDVPVSACGVTLGVVTTVRIIAAYGVNNYINFVKGNPLKKMIVNDGFAFVLDAF